jgi:opacity protein-like surface antigen
MRIGFSSSCAIGLAIALTLGGVSTAKAQQPDSTTRKTTTRTARRTHRTTRSSQRIPISKDRNTSTGEVAAQPAPTPTVNQDSIAAAERARQDSIAAVERARQDSIARVEQMRRDSIAAAERRRQDSIAAVEKARQDSIARADSIAAAEAAALRLRRWAGGPYIGIAGGLSMPMGDLKSAAANTGGYDNGWNVTVPIGWDFSNTPFGIRVDGSFDRLGAKNFSSSFKAPDVTVYSGNADVKLRLPLGRTWSRFYVIGGATASKFTGYNQDFTNPNAPTNQQTFSNASWKWGYNVGGGFNFNFGRMTGLFVESRYISVSPDNVTGFPYGEAKFVPIILGIQF